MAETSETLYALGLSVEYTSSIRLELNEPESRDHMIHLLGQKIIEHANDWAELAGEDGATNVPIIGAIIGEGSSKDRRQVVLGIDPSRSFGTPNPAQCEAVAQTIIDEEGWRRVDEALPELRVPLGARRGYELDAKVYSLAEERRLFAAKGKTALKLVQADLFSLRAISGKVSAYHEPGFLVDGSTNAFAAILEVAHETGQDRLVPGFTGKSTQVYQEAK